MQEPALGLAHFLSQSDGVGKFVLALLVLMSVASWTLIASKGVSLWRLRRRGEHFLHFFWQAPDLVAVRTHVRARIEEAGIGDPFSALVHEGFAALEQHARPGEGRLMTAGSAEEFLTRALRRSIEHSTAKLESGLTLLASVGSSAPFIGLFGTVWGIYHALLAIGLSGQGTLDKVAGPVGEALIMTALGLAVAIPAVLAYNAFVRAHRVMLAELESFAHDLFAFMATGSRGGEAEDKVPGEVPAPRAACPAAVAGGQA